MIKFLNNFLFTTLICATFQANAADQAQTPHQVVQQTTEQVLAIIKDAKGYYDKDPQRFNTQVTSVLEKVIDFDNFTRGVMGTYASAQRYKALQSDAEKTAFNEHIQRFTATFKKGLIDTYAKGLLNFNGQKIETLPPRKGDDVSSGSVTVMQNIFNDSGKPYVIQYSMRRNKEGEWKLQNLIIEGINLGLTYRSQFTESADLNKGDLDKVIANWKVEPKAVSELKKDDATKPEASKANASKEAKKVMAARATLNIDGDTLSLSGLLDFESVLEVDKQGQEWLEGSAPAEANLDLSAITYANSAGIVLLLGWLRVAQQQQKKLHIQHIPANMAALAKVGGLEDFMATAAET